MSQQTLRIISFKPICFISQNKILLPPYDYLIILSYCILINLYLLIQKNMTQLTPIDQFLTTIQLQRYAQVIKNYGVQTMQDLLILTPNDWQVIKVLPFHRNKMIHSAATMKDAKVEQILKNKLSNSCLLHQYTFTYSGIYANDHKPQSLNNFEPAGFGLSSTADCWMKFTFVKPVTVYGVIIGNNIGVTGGWNHSYLQGVQMQVKQTGSQEYKTVHTIKGMPNAANTAYLAKIQSNNVEEVKFYKNSYFSTSYIHFV